MNEVHIPTVGGNSNVITLDVKTSGRFLKYIALLTQTGVLAPVPTVLENTLGADIVWGYGAVGYYTGDLIGAFTVGKTTMLNGQEYGGLNVVTISSNKTNADQVYILSKLTASDHTGRDGALLNTTVQIEVQQNDLATNEEVFNDILSSLDAIQTSLWTKIVVRFGGTVTEVDGATYRRTTNFNNSSKLINS